MSETAHTHASDSTKLERAASWLSMTCAVHCLVVPVLPAVLPLIGASGTHVDDPAVDTALLALVVCSAVMGAAWGFRRHRDARVTAAMALGLCVYALGHALPASWLAQLVSVGGGLVLAGASFTSARRSHEHGEACAH